MPVLKNIRHEKFCQGVASGLPAGRAYEKAGYGKKGADQNAARLIRKDKIAARIKELQARIAESLVKQSIAVKEARIAALNDRWERMQRVIEERAQDASMLRVAGGQTGLLAHDRKSVGSGPMSEVIDVFEVDTGLLRELREHEVQAAKELGQWEEKDPLGSRDNPISVIVRHIGSQD